MANEIIGIIVKAILAVLSLILTGYAVPWLKSVTTEKQRVTLWNLVKNLVQAAQTMAIFSKGQERKAYVNGQLAAKGIDITEEVEALRRSAVYELTKSGEE